VDGLKIRSDSLKFGSPVEAKSTYAHGSCNTEKAESKYQWDLQLVTPVNVLARRIAYVSPD
jgi:hypothetical protein